MQQSGLWHLNNNDGLISPQITIENQSIQGSAMWEPTIPRSQPKLAIRGIYP